MASSQSPINHDDGSSYEPPELPPEVLQPCNEICNDFEGAWNRGEITPVESLKKLVLDRPADERSWLLYYLLQVELEFRYAELGDDLLEVYEKHFPEDRLKVRKAIQQVATDSETASVSETTPLRSPVLKTEDTVVCCPECEGEISAHSPERDIGTCSGCGSTFDIAPSPFEQRKLITLPQDFGIGQRYRLVKYLGCGAFGTVYKAIDCELQTTVALKVAHKHHLFSNEENYQRFRREARAAADLDHPNIVPVRDIVDDQNVLFLVCKYIDGSSLSEVLKTDPPTDFNEIAQLIRQLALALSYAHGNTDKDRKGIIHRDVKPANILVDSNGDAFLTDFGLARPAIDDEALESLTADGHFMGTPAYASPEHYLSHKSVDGRSDLFSLGIVLYELLTGQRPFQGDLPSIQSQILEETPVASPNRHSGSAIPRDLETICLKCLEKSPEKRYQTAGELAEDLERFLNREPIRARRVSPVERGFRWVRKNPVTFVLSLALTLLLSIIVLLFSIILTIDHLDDITSDAEFIVDDPIGENEGENQLADLAAVADKTIGLRPFQQKEDLQKLLEEPCFPYESNESFLLACLENKYPTIRSSAADAAGATIFVGDEIIDILKKMEVDDEDEACKTAAKKAIENINALKPSFEESVSQ